MRVAIAAAIVSVGLFALGTTSEAAKNPSLPDAAERADFGACISRMKSLGHSEASSSRRCRGERVRGAKTRFRKN